jgi:hypothetical protein
MFRSAFLLAMAFGLLAYAGQDEPPVLRRKPTPPPEEKQDDKSQDDKAQDSAKDSGKSTTKPAPARSTQPPRDDSDNANYPATQRPVPQQADPRDPGAPKLKRGAQAHPQGPEAPEPDPPPPPAPASRPTAGARPDPDQPSSVITTDSEGHVASVDRRLPQVSTEDPVIEQAREAAAEYDSTLPNFICDQLTRRNVSNTLKPNWRYKDRVEVELIYVEGKEDYRNVRLNGRPLKKGSPEDSGTWSSGEFGTILVDIFSPSTNANFVYRGESNAAGLSAKLYDFSVRQPNSHWQIRYGRVVKPAYKGSVWIDSKTGRALRIEMNTKQLPRDYEVDDVEVVVDYGWVLISGQKYLLPVKSENLACFRGTFDCTMNEIEFRNYRKFTAESQVLQVDSDVTFPEADDPKKKKGTTTPPSISEPPPADPKKP